MNTLRGCLHFAALLVWPPWWQKLYRQWRAYKAPIEVKVGSGDDVVHPRVGPALEVLIEMVQGCKEAENFLTFNLSGPTLGGETWKLTVSKRGYDPYDAAATYKNALKEAGIQIPVVGPAGELLRTRAFYNQRNRMMPSFLRSRRGECASCDEHAPGAGETCPECLSTY